MKPRLAILATTAALSIAAVSAPAAAQQFCGAYDPYGAAASEGARAQMEAELAKAGLHPVSIQVETQPSTSSDTFDFSGWLGWAKVQECGKGYAMVRLDRLCSLQNIAGNGGCDIDKR